MTYEEKLKNLRTARKTLHILENRGILENNLSTEHITAIRIAEFALDELCKSKDVQPVKRGRWIDHEQFERKNCNVCIECSVCNKWFGHDCIPKTKFCPNCGARMDGDIGGRVNEQDI